jgi:hypothetical protein
MGFQLVKYITLEAQVRKRNYKECEGKKRVQHKAANFRWTRSSLLVSIVVLLIKTGQAYSSLVLR